MRTAIAILAGSLLLLLLLLWVSPLQLHSQAGEVFSGEVVGVTDGDTVRVMRDAVYANRRRIRGARGLALQRRRSEYLERPNAHLYETGGLRRTHVRGHANILKRLLIQTSAFNLSLLMRTLIGVGTPRGLQGRLAAVWALVVALWTPDARSRAPGWYRRARNSPTLLSAGETAHVKIRVRKGGTC